MTKASTAQNTRGIVVIHRGRIIGERYTEGWGPYTPQIGWSMGKSIAATLTGVLVQQGALAIDQPAPVPEWQSDLDPRRDILLADLLRMSSGLDFDNFGLNPNRFVQRGERALPHLLRRARRVRARGRSAVAR